MKTPKLDWSGGTEVATLTLYGNPKKQAEPETVRVNLPFGDVDITRCADGSYWVHVRKDTAQDVREESAERAGRFIDARVDVKGRHASESSAGDFGHPDTYHVAVRIGAA
jgi:hypothetical protein